MASQVSPGVIIRERDLSNAVVVGDVAITAAFASTFVKEIGRASCRERV